MLRIPLLAASTLVLAAALTQIQTTSEDFTQPGSLPGDLTDPIQSVQQCTFCHANYDPEVEPYTRWAGGMMSNAMRDPVFHAALAIANQDLAEAGEFCLRCHTPGGWLAGRATPADGSALAGSDYEGITCNFCHRMVDPVADAENPPADAAILAGLTAVPTEFHNGQYVVDPLDVRRGPFDLGAGFLWHPWAESPFHRESAMCATCHEVSNPAVSRIGGPTPQITDTYELNTNNMQHPTHSKLDQFPIERTYTEWALSDFAVAPIDMGGRFGGNKTLVSSCQDCHMPDTTGSACAPGLNGETRTDLPHHDFAGANSWVPLAIHSLDQSNDLYGPAEINGAPLSVFQDAVDRNIDMLQRASDLEISVQGGDILCRITNQTGHKLPTGYPEGRRMWLNVKFYNRLGNILKEHGAYDDDDAELTTSDTKVYEVKLGLDATMAAATGLPAGESFHAAVSNVVFQDNRIPPRGFTNAAYEANQILPIGATYADGQYWDDTLYAIPKGTAKVEVNLYHQTTTKEFIEFLRDENTTNNTGQIAYDEWEAAGKSAPVLMASANLRLQPSNLSGGLGGPAMSDPAGN